MAFNGSGTFVRLFNWVTDAAGAVKIRADRMDSEMDGFATGLTNTICRDGQSTTTARIPFASGIQVNTGLVGTPSINVAGDTDTGVYSPGADQWAVTAGGTQRFLVNGGAVSVTGTFAVSGASTFTGAATMTGVTTFPAGSAGAPSGTFSGDTNTGFFQVGADRFGIAAGGSLIVDVTTGGINVTGQVNPSGNIAVNTNKFTVAATTGDTLVAGTLSVTGNIAVNTNKFNINATTGAFTAAGAAGITGTLTVTGAATLAAGSTMGGNPITNFPSGTVAIFQQTSAPTAWTKLTTHNDKALRIVSGAVSSGGTVDLSTASITIAQGNLPNYNLSLASVTCTIGNDPHTHDYLAPGANVSRGDSGTLANVAGPRATIATSANSPGITGTIGGTLPSGGSGTPLSLGLKYADVIAASKD